MTKRSTQIMCRASEQELEIKLNGLAMREVHYNPTAIGRRVTQHVESAYVLQLVPLRNKQLSDLVTLVL